MLARHDLMVNRWALTVEVIDGEGERSAGTFTSPDLRQWDSLGLLDHALEQERADIHARAVRGEDDED